MRTWVQRIRAISPWIVPVFGVALGVTVTQAQQAAAQNDPAKVQEVFTAMRAAMGGDKAASLKSLSGEGTSVATFGERQVNNDLEFKVVLPDHIQRVMTPEMPNGMPGPRIAMTLNGSEAWAGSLDPMPNFGGGGGGGNAGGGQRRGGGPGGGGFGMFGGGGGPDASARVRGDMLRFALGIVSAPDALTGVTYSYLGTAQSKDGGEADVLGVKGDGLDGKLFIDKKTHLPLMVTYMARDLTRVRIPRGPNAAGGGANGGGENAPAADPNETPEARQKRLAEEAQKRREDMRKQLENAPMVENELFYADYKKVDGVMLPFQFTRAVNGTPQEQTEIKKYKINPKIDLNDFQKKGS